MQIVGDRPLYSRSNISALIVVVSRIGRLKLLVLLGGALTNYEFLAFI